MSLPKMGEPGSGVWICDLADLPFPNAREPLDENLVANAMERLETCLAEHPETALEELVEMAVELCGADSSGISLEESQQGGQSQFRWVAVAGSFRKYLNGTTPRFYSPCGTCIDRGVSQRYTVAGEYYNFLGVNADPIVDGILIPWRSHSMIGTLWLVSHSSHTFTENDYLLLKELSNFVTAGLAAQSPCEDSVVVGAK